MLFIYILFQIETLFHWYIKNEPTKEQHILK